MTANRLLHPKPLSKPFPVDVFPRRTSPRIRDQAALIDQCCENIADISASYQKEKGDDAAAW